MITRQQAVETLYQIAEDPNMSEELQDKAEQIATAILYENYSVHLWGATTDEIEDFSEYVFIPSDREEDEIKANVETAAEDSDADEMLTAPQSDETTENDK